MALSAPARKLTTHAVQEPLPVEPPQPRKRPRDRPRPGGQGRSSATASVATPAPPKRKSGTTKRRKTGSGSGRKGSSGAKGPTGAKGSRAAATDSPIRRTKSSSRAATATAAAPARKAPTRKAPARRKVAPRRRPAGVIPIAAGAAGTAVRGAVAVTQLPESGLIHRLTRGRAWIGLLGVLLVGIVALNVVTLSFAASAGKIDARNQELGKENSMLQNRSSTKYGQGRITNEAKKLGLSASTQANPQVINASSGDVSTAAARLGAAAAGTAAAGSGESAEGEAATGEEAGTGEETAASAGGSGAGEEAATGETGEAAESEFTPEELEIYEAEYAELLASEGGG